MSFRLTIEPIGETLEVAEGQTILDAALRQGVWLPHACCHGLCSSCKVDVLEGEVDQGDASPFALMDFEREEGKTLACCATLRSDVTIEADIEEDEDALYLPVRDHVGEVVRVADLTPDIKGVWLRVDGEGCTFQAGQYVNLEVPGVEGPRAFSIASAPADPTLLELQIKRVPDGRATGYIHDELAVGTRLRFAGPYGQFFVRKSLERPRLFIAGGSGLSAILAMVRDLLHEGLEEKTFVFHGARDVAGLHCRDELEALAAEEPLLHYVPVISGETGDWPGETGFVHEALERAFEGRFAGHQAYLCGPPPMIEATIRTLMKGRLFEKDIFTEKFVTRADGEGALAKSVVFKRI